MSSIWKLLRRRFPASSRSSKSEQSRLERELQDGNALEDAGQYEEALAKYRMASGHASEDIRPHINVGNALRHLGRLDDAAAAYRQAIAIQPRHARVRFNLGAVLAESGQFDLAELELKEALRLTSTLVEAVIVLADIYAEQMRLTEAEAQFERALTLAPNHAGVMLNFGMFCVRQNRLDEAMNWFQQAKAVDPGLKDAESSLLFCLNFRSDLTPEEISREHQRVGDAITRASGESCTFWTNSVERMRRLRVAYVSGDFVHHPTTLFLKPVLENHNRKNFEIFCYSNQVTVHPAGAALRERSDHWRNIGQLSDDQMVEVIRADGIDILVDLSGHTNRNRVTVFARHPAPVQISWLGYLNTTGIAAMDYRICDWHTDPEGTTESLHTERLIRMPHSQWCYAPWYELERVQVPHRERPEALVFGSFNQSVKISDACLKLWAKILARVPAAQLVVMDVRTPIARKILLERFERLGINSSRIETRGREDILDYFYGIANVDIALDTFPYNGATTTLDTLWMDTPVVGLLGDRGISRGTYSILSSLGANDLIARSEDEYVDVNVRLALDQHWRESIRATLRNQLSPSVLMNAPLFTGALEERFRHAWSLWCEQQEARRAP